MAGNQGIATENIDEVILRLLKLKSGMEIDYQTYFNIIKKKLKMHTMLGKELPNEEQNLLQEELKRIKRIKDKEKRRFKIKEKKTRVFSQTPGERVPKTSAIIKAPRKGKITTQKLFNKSSIEEVNVKDITENKKQDFTEILKSPLERISEKLDSIIQTLTDIDKENRKKSEKERIESEDEKRRNREKELESKLFEGIKGAVKGILKPFQSIWDIILNFIKNIILGRILIKLVNWIADPNNQGKIQSIIRFFSDWWPALLGSYVLFGTSFGKFIRATLSMLGRFIFQVGKFGIPQLLKFIKTPLGAGIALFTAGATIPSLFPQTVNEQERNTKNLPETEKDKIKQLQSQKANLNFFEKLQGKESEIDEQIYYLQTGKTKSYGFNGGGFSGGLGYLSNGFVSGKKGRDQIPAMLTDGEFVMSVGAVNKYGVETLEAMNAAGGGTNQPKIVGGKTYAYGGGEIGRYGTDREQKSTGSLLTDPIGALSRIYKQSSEKFFPEYDNKKDQSYSPPPTSSGNRPSNNSKSTGSLLTDPFGAARRIYGKFFPKKDNTPPPLPSISDYNKGKSTSPTPKSNKNVEPGIPEKIIKSSTFRDSGLLYLRSMMGGLGGPITEQQLSKESINELNKAVERAKKRRSKELSIAESDLQRAKKEKWSNLQEIQSIYDRLKRGEIRVEYQDYYENGKISKSAEDAKSILGKFWARSSVDGGYRVTNEKYDFIDMPNPWQVIIGDSRGISKEDSKKPKRDITLRERLQAFHQINPFAREMEVDMILGKNKGNPMRTLQNTARSIVISTPPGMLIGNIMQTFNNKSPEKPQTEKQKANQKSLETKRPWWDKMGWFGGASSKIKQDEKKSQQFLKNNPGVKIYNKSKPNQNVKQPYKSKFSRPPTTTKSPVKPPPKPSPKTKVNQYRGGQRSSGARPSQVGTKPPSFSPTHSSRSTITARSTLGISKK